MLPSMYMCTHTHVYSCICILVNFLSLHLGRTMPQAASSLLNAACPGLTLWNGTCSSGYCLLPCNCTLFVSHPAWTMREKWLCVCSVTPWPVTLTVSTVIFGRCGFLWVCPLLRLLRNQLLDLEESRFPFSFSPGSFEKAFSVNTLPTRPSILLGNSVLCS